MIIPDVNLLVYAMDRQSPFHAAARTWWEETLNREPVVGLPWVSVSGFIRIVTNSRAVHTPATVNQAVTAVEAWLALPNVNILHPGERHSNVFFQFLRDLGTGGKLTTDAQLAAISIEHQGRLASNDADFSRFPGLLWYNPLSS